MATLTTHEEIRLKITAYMFNRRADALRGEIYQALCLGAFVNPEEKLNRDEIVKKVAFQLGEKVKVSDSLKAVIFEELRNLVNDGRLIPINGEFIVNQESNPIELQQDNVHIELEKMLFEPIKVIASSITSDPSPSTIKKLVAFFIEASSLIANDQVNSLSKGKRYVDNAIDDKDKLQALINNLWDIHGLDDSVDYDLFITKSLIHPDGQLADYLYKLIQVNIITRLLSWDPDLEFLRKSILANKILYLDSSTLFVLMQNHHPLHYILHGMLLASKNDLGVNFKIHESTIKEYQSALDGADKEITHSYKGNYILDRPRQMC